MSAVTIIAAGAKANAGVASAVDVSVHTTIRFDVAVSAAPKESADNTRFLLEIEHGPTSNGPWKRLWAQRYNGRADVAAYAKVRDVLTGFDSFVRGKWTDEASPASTGPGRAHLNTPDASSYGLTISIIGDGKPDAA